jgi:predicted metal-dependent enzyme (double-stranded beta helix superfamily)
MDELVARESRPAELAQATAAFLQPRLGDPAFLPPRFCEPDPHRYRQHVVHVHPDGLYSLVSLVWRPGQATPVHDHRCWCVVGVHRGTEHETRYHLVADREERWLVEIGTMISSPGTVAVLVPPAENIHRVANGGDAIAISLHVYGADIAACGTSINEIFDEPVRDPEADAAMRPLAWRRASQVS